MTFLKGAIMNPNNVIGHIVRIWGYWLVPILVAVLLVSAFATDEPIINPAIDAVALLMTLMYILYIALEPTWKTEEDA